MLSELRLEVQGGASESKEVEIVNVPAHSQLAEWCGHCCLWETLWIWLDLTECLMEQMNQQE